MSSRRSALVGFAGAVTLTAVLGACSQDDTRKASDEPTVERSTTSTSAISTSATPTATADPTQSESATPTISDSPRSATPAPTATEPDSDLTTRLLPARAVGGLNEQWTWRSGETRTTEPTSGGIADCVRFSLAAIGANDVVTRAYLPPTKAADARASVLHVVAELPDEQTAVRVMEVLRSWHSGCQRRLNDVSDQPHRVSDTAAVPAGDDAFAYLHSTPGATPDTTLFEDVAQVRVGQLVSLVVVRLDEQDYNYEPQRTPAARSLAAAAARLG